MEIGRVGVGILVTDKYSATEEQKNKARGKGQMSFSDILIGVCTFHHNIKAMGFFKQSTIEFVLEKTAATTACRPQIKNY